MITIKKVTETDEWQEILKREFHVQDSLEDPFRTCFGCYDDENMIGLIDYSSLYDHADLNYIWIDPSYRRHKIGTRLVAKMNQDLNKHGIFRVTLEVNETNKEAIAFYEDLGFRKEAIRKNYYRENDGILMVLELGE